ncbi:hypothetical protein KIH74_25425, partial [Kineosporia sp. J2-2]
MARPGDWSPLGMDGDPVPGDAEAVDAIVDYLKLVQTAASDADSGIQQIMNGTGDGAFVGKTADWLRDEIESKTKTFLSAVADAFETATPAMSTYAQKLRDAQAAADSALSQAQGLGEDDEDQKNTLKSMAESARADLEAAASAAAAAVDSAAHATNPWAKSACEEFWDAFFWILLVITVIAIIFGGAWGLIAFAGAVIWAIKSIVDYATGHGSVLELVLGIVGALFPTTKGLAQLMKGFGGAAKNIIKAGVQGLKNLATNTWNMMKNLTLGTFVKGIGDIGSAIVNAVKVGSIWVVNGVAGAGAFAHGFTSLSGTSLTAWSKTAISTIVGMGKSGLTAIDKAVTTAFKSSFQFLGDHLGGWQWLRIFLPVAADEIRVLGLGGATKLSILGRGLGIESQLNGAVLTKMAGLVQLTDGVMKVTGIGKNGALDAFGKPGIIVSQMTGGELSALDQFSKAIVDIPQISSADLLKNFGVKGLGELNSALGKLDPSAGKFALDNITGTDWQFHSLTESVTETPGGLVLPKTAFSAVGSGAGGLGHSAGGIDLSGATLNSAGRISGLDGISMAGGNIASNLGSIADLGKIVMPARFDAGGLSSGFSGVSHLDSVSRISNLHSSLNFGEVGSGARVTNGSIDISVGNMRLTDGVNSISFNDLRLGNGSTSFTLDGAKFTDGVASIGTNNLRVDNIQVSTNLGRLDVPGVGTGVGKVDVPSVGTGVGTGVGKLDVPGVGTGVGKLDVPGTGTGVGKLDVPGTGAGAGKVDVDVPTVNSGASHLDSPVVGNANIQAPGANAGSGIRITDGAGSVDVNKVVVTDGTGRIGLNEARFTNSSGSVQLDMNNLKLTDGVNTIDLGGNLRLIDSAGGTDAIGGVNGLAEHILSGSGGINGLKLDGTGGAALQNLSKMISQGADGSTSIDLSGLTKGLSDAGVGGAASGTRGLIDFNSIGKIDNVGMSTALDDFASPELKKLMEGEFKIHQLNDDSIKLELYRDPADMIREKFGNGGVEGLDAGPLAGSALPPSVGSMHAPHVDAPAVRADAPGLGGAGRGADIGAPSTTPRTDKFLELLHEGPARTPQIDHVGDLPKGSTASIEHIDGSSARLADDLDSGVTTPDSASAHSTDVDSVGSTLGDVRPDLAGGEVPTPRTTETGDVPMAMTRDGSVVDPSVHPSVSDGSTTVVGSGSTVRTVSDLPVDTAGVNAQVDRLWHTASESEAVANFHIAQGLVHHAQESLKIGKATEGITKFELRKLENELNIARTVILRRAEAQLDNLGLDKAAVNQKMLDLEASDAKFGASRAELDNLYGERISKLTQELADNPLAGGKISGQALAHGGELDPIKALKVTPDEWTSIERAAADLKLNPSAFNERTLQVTLDSLGVDRRAFDEFSKNSEMGPSASQIAQYRDSSNWLLGRGDTHTDAQIRDILTSDPEALALREAFAHDDMVRGIFDGVFAEHVARLEPYLSVNELRALQQLGQERLDFAKWSADPFRTGDGPVGAGAEDLQKIFRDHDSAVSLKDKDPETAGLDSLGDRATPPPGEISLSGISKVWNDYLDAVRTTYQDLRNSSPDDFELDQAFTRRLEELGDGLKEAFGREARYERDVLIPGLDRFDSTVADLHLGKGYDPDALGGGIERARQAFAGDMRGKFNQISRDLETSFDAEISFENAARVGDSVVTDARIERLDQAFAPGGDSGWGKALDDISDGVGDRLRFEIEGNTALEAGGRDFEAIASNSALPEKQLDAIAADYREDLAIAYHDAYGASGSARNWLDHEAGSGNVFGDGRDAFGKQVLTASDAAYDHSVWAQQVMRNFDSLINGNRSATAVDDVVAGAGDVAGVRGAGDGVQVQALADLPARGDLGTPSGTRGLGDDVTVRGSGEAVSVRGDVDSVSVRGDVDGVSAHADVDGVSAHVDVDGVSGSASDLAGADVPKVEDSVLGDGVPVQQVVTPPRIAPVESPKLFPSKDFLYNNPADAISHDVQILEQRFAGAEVPQALTDRMLANFSEQANHLAEAYRAKAPVMTAQSAAVHLGMDYGKLVQAQQSWLNLHVSVENFGARLEQRVLGEINAADVDHLSPGERVQVPTAAGIEAMQAGQQGLAQVLKDFSNSPGEMTFRVRDAQMQMLDLSRGVINDMRAKIAGPAAPELKSSTWYSLPRITDQAGFAAQADVRVDQAAQHFAGMLERAGIPAEFSGRAIENFRNAADEIVAPLRGEGVDSSTVVAAAQQFEKLNQHTYTWALAQEKIGNWSQAMNASVEKRISALGPDTAPYRQQLFDTAAADAGSAIRQAVDEAGAHLGLPTDTLGTPRAAYEELLAGATAKIDASRTELLEQIRQAFTRADVRAMNPGEVGRAVLDGETNWGQSMIDSLFTSPALQRLEIVTERTETGLVETVVRPRALDDVDVPAASPFQPTTENLMTLTVAPAQDGRIPSLSDITDLVEALPVALRPTDFKVAAQLPFTADDLHLILETGPFAPDLVAAAAARAAADTGFVYEVSETNLLGDGGLGSPAPHLPGDLRIAEGLGEGLGLPAGVTLDRSAAATIDGLSGSLAGVFAARASALADCVIALETLNRAITGVRFGAATVDDALTPQARLAQQIGAGGWARVGNSWDPVLRAVASGPHLTTAYVYAAPPNAPMHALAAINWHGETYWVDLQAAGVDRPVVTDASSAPMPAVDAHALVQLPDGSPAQLTTATTATSTVDALVDPALTTVPRMTQGGPAYEMKPLARSQRRAAASAATPRPDAASLDRVQEVTLALLPDSGARDWGRTLQTVRTRIDVAFAQADHRVTGAVVAAAGTAVDQVRALPEVSADQIDVLDGYVTTLLNAYRNAAEQSARDLITRLGDVARVPGQSIVTDIRPVLPAYTHDGALGSGKILKTGNFTSAFDVVAGINGVLGTALPPSHVVQLETVLRDGAIGLSDATRMMNGGLPLKDSVAVGERRYEIRLGLDLQGGLPLSADPDAADLIEYDVRYQTQQVDTSAGSTSQRAGTGALTDAIALGTDVALRSTGVPLSTKANEQRTTEPVNGTGTEWSRNVKGMIGTTEFVAAARLTVSLTDLGSGLPAAVHPVGQGRVWARFYNEAVRMTPAVDSSDVAGKGKAPVHVSVPTPLVAHPVIAVPATMFDTGTRVVSPLLDVFHAAEAIDAGELPSLVRSRLGAELDETSTGLVNEFFGSENLLLNVGFIVGGKMISSVLPVHGGTALIVTAGVSSVQQVDTVAKTTLRQDSGSSVKQETKRGLSTTADVGVGWQGTSQLGKAAEKLTGLGTYSSVTVSLSGGIGRTKPLTVASGNNAGTKSVLEYTGPARLYLVRMAARVDLDFEQTAREKTDRHIDFGRPVEAEIVQHVWVPEDEAADFERLVAAPREGVTSTPDVPAITVTEPGAASAEIAGGQSLVNRIHNAQARIIDSEGEIRYLPAGLVTGQSSAGAGVDRIPGAEKILDEIERQVELAHPGVLAKAGVDGRTAFRRQLNTPFSTPGVLTRFGRAQATRIALQGTIGGHDVRVVVQADDLRFEYARLQSDEHNGTVDISNKNSQKLDLKQTFGMVSRGGVDVPFLAPPNHAKGVLRAFNPVGGGSGSQTHQMAATGGQAVKSNSRFKSSKDKIQFLTFSADFKVGVTFGGAVPTGAGLLDLPANAVTLPGEVRFAIAESLLPRTRVEHPQTLGRAVTGLSDADVAAFKATAVRFGGLSSQVIPVGLLGLRELEKAVLSNLGDTGTVAQRRQFAESGVAPESLLGNLELLLDGTGLPLAELIDVGLVWDTHSTGRVKVWFSQPKAVLETSAGAADNVNESSVRLDFQDKYARSGEGSAGLGLTLRKAPPESSPVSNVTIAPSYQYRRGGRAEWSRSDNIGGGVRRTGRDQDLHTLYQSDMLVEITGWRWVQAVGSMRLVEVTTHVKIERGAQYLLGAMNARALGLPGLNPPEVDVEVVEVKAETSKTAEPKLLPASFVNDGHIFGLSETAALSDPGAVLAETKELLARFVPGYRDAGWREVPTGTTVSLDAALQGRSLRARLGTAHGAGIVLVLPRDLPGLPYRQLVQVKVTMTQGPATAGGQEVNVGLDNFMQSSARQDAGSGSGVSRSHAGGITTGYTTGKSHRPGFGFSGGYAPEAGTSLTETASKKQNFRIKPKNKKSLETQHPVVFRVEVSVAYEPSQFLDAASFGQAWLTSPAWTYVSTVPSTLTLRTPMDLAVTGSGSGHVARAPRISSGPHTPVDLRGQIPEQTWLAGSKFLPAHFQALLSGETAGSAAAFRAVPPGSPVQQRLHLLASEEGASASAPKMYTAGGLTVPGTPERGWFTDTVHHLNLKLGLGDLVVLNPVDTTTGGFTPIRIGTEHTTETGREAEQGFSLEKSIGQGGVFQYIYTELAKGANEDNIRLGDAHSAGTAPQAGRANVHAKGQSANAGRVTEETSELDIQGFLFRATAIHDSTRLSSSRRLTNQGDRIPTGSSRLTVANGAYVLFSEAQAVEIGLVRVETVGEAKVYRLGPNARTEAPATWSGLVADTRSGISLDGSADSARLGDAMPAVPGWMTVTGSFDSGTQTVRIGSATAGRDLDATEFATWLSEQPNWGGRSLVLAIDGIGSTAGRTEQQTFPFLVRDRLGVEVLAPTGDVSLLPVPPSEIVESGPQATLRVLAPMVEAASGLGAVRAGGEPVPVSAVRPQAPTFAWFAAEHGVSSRDVGPDLVEALGTMGAPPAAGQELNWLSARYQPEREEVFVIGDDEDLAEPEFTGPKIKLPETVPDALTSHGMRPVDEAAVSLVRAEANLQLARLVREGTPPVLRDAQVERLMERVREAGAVVRTVHDLAWEVLKQHLGDLRMLGGARPFRNLDVPFFGESPAGPSNYIVSSDYDSSSDVAGPSYDADSSYDVGSSDYDESGSVGGSLTGADRTPTQPRFGFSAPFGEDLDFYSREIDEGAATVLPGALAPAGTVPLEISALAAGFVAGNGRLDWSLYQEMHAAVVDRVGGTSQISDGFSRRPLGAAEPAADLFAERIGGRKLIGTVAEVLDGVRPVTFLDTFSRSADPLVTVGYGKDEAAAIFDRILLEHRVLLDESGSHLDLARASARTVRALQVSQLFTGPNSELNVGVVLPFLLSRSGFEIVDLSRLRDAFNGQTTLDDLTARILAGVRMPEPVATTTVLTSSTIETTDLAATLDIRITPAADDSGRLGIQAPSAPSAALVAALSEHLSQGGGFRLDGTGLDHASAARLAGEAPIDLLYRPDPQASQWHRVVSAAAGDFTGVVRQGPVTLVDGQAWWKDAPVEEIPVSDAQALIDLVNRGLHEMGVRWTTAPQFDVFRVDGPPAGSRDLTDVFRGDLVEAGKRWQLQVMRTLWDAAQRGTGQETGFTLPVRRGPNFEDTISVRITPVSQWFVAELTLESVPVRGAGDFALTTGDRRTWTGMDPRAEQEDLWALEPSVRENLQAHDISLLDLRRDHLAGDFPVSFRDFVGRLTTRLADIDTRAMTEIRAQDGLLARWNAQAEGMANPFTRDAEGQIYARNGRDELVPVTGPLVDLLDEVPGLLASAFRMGLTDRQIYHRLNLLSHTQGDATLAEAVRVLVEERQDAPPRYHTMVWHDVAAGRPMPTLAEVLPSGVIDRAVRSGMTTDHLDQLLQVAHATNGLGDFPRWITEIVDGRLREQEQRPPSPALTEPVADVAPAGPQLEQVLDPHWIQRGLEAGLPLETMHAEAVAAGRVAEFTAEVFRGIQEFDAAVAREAQAVWDNHPAPELEQGLEPVFGRMAADADGLRAERVARSLARELGLVTRRPLPSVTDPATRIAGSLGLTADAFAGIEGELSLGELGRALSDLGQGSLAWIVTPGQVTTLWGRTGHEPLWWNPQAPVGQRMRPLSQHAPIHDDSQVMLARPDGSIVSADEVRGRFTPITADLLRAELARGINGGTNSVWWQGQVAVAVETLSANQALGGDRAALVAEARQLATTSVGRASGDRDGLTGDFSPRKAQLQSQVVPVLAAATVSAAPAQGRITHTLTGEIQRLSRDLVRALGLHSSADARAGSVNAGASVSSPADSRQVGSTLLSHDALVRRADAIVARAQADAGVVECLVVLEALSASLYPHGVAGSGTADDLALAGAAARSRFGAGPGWVAAGSWDAVEQRLVEV